MIKTKFAEIGQKVCTELVLTLVEDSCEFLSSLHQKWWHFTVGNPDKPVLKLMKKSTDGSFAVWNASGHEILLNIDRYPTWNSQKFVVSSKAFPYVRLRSVLDKKNHRIIVNYLVKRKTLIIGNKRNTKHCASSENLYSVWTVLTRRRIQI